MAYEMIAYNHLHVPSYFKGFNILIGIIYLLLIL